MAKLSATGSVLWAKNMAAGATGYIETLGIGVDKSGNLLVTGGFEGTTHFGSFSLTSAGGYDIFVLKVNSAGNVLWARDLGGTGTDYGAAVALDKSGNIYVGGSTNGDPSVSFLLGQAYVAKLNSSGTLLWTRQYGTGSEDIVGSLALDGAGNLYVGGIFQNTISFDSFSFTSAGSGDNGFVIKLNSAGAVQWAHGLVGAGDNQFAYVAVDASFNVYFAGNFQEMLNVDTDPQGTNTLTSAGYSDGLVLELTQSGPLSYTAPASAGPASYTLQLSQGYLDLVDNSTGLVVAEKSIDDTTAVQIIAANGVDTTLVLDYGTGTTDVPVTFTGGSGNNTLVGPALGAAWDITAANAGKVGMVKFTKVANLVGGPAMTASSSAPMAVSRGPSLVAAAATRWITRPGRPP